MKTLLLILASACTLMAQPQKLFFYSGSDLTYICESRNQTSDIRTTWARSDSTLTSIVISGNVATVTTSTAHQLYDGARFTIAGSTAAAIDGNFTVVTTPSSTTFTANITASNATHTEAGMSLYTNSPLLNATYWAIQIFFLEASVVQSFRWEALSSHNVKCSDRSLYK